MRLRSFVATLVTTLLVGLLTAPAAFAFGERSDGNSDGNRGHQSSKSQSSHKQSGHKRSGDATTTRGKSPSTPDQDGKGMDRGLFNNDKTGEGNDGNNGCGNDADREDDNNGWCGLKPKPAHPEQAVTAFSVVFVALHKLDVDVPTVKTSAVLTVAEREAMQALIRLFGVRTSDSAAAVAPDSSTPDSSTGVAVLGTQFTSDTAPAVTGDVAAVRGGVSALATTGASVALIALVGMAALGTGLILRHGPRL